MAKRVTKARTPPFEPYPAWSTAKFMGFLRSGLRATYNKWPPKWEVLKAAKRDYTGSNKRQKHEYQCNVCKKWYSGKEVSIDHIVPAGSLTSFEDLPGFVERLFVGADKLQCICKTCHDAKTKEENKLRKESK